jgi:energy-coupling factor transporter ATP-binding protein EcfA2
VVVFAGPTGSGKSTLINTLTGRDLSETGSLRPTTSAPVVLASEANASRFGAGRWVDCEVMTGSAPMLVSMALVDTPDIDSTATEHRDKAESLIEVADVVVFVTSALRYADEVAWKVLRRATARGADVIHVLNRATSGNSGAVVDLRRRLRLEGLDERLVTIPEHHIPTGGQRIPSLAVRALRRRLAIIAADRERATGSTRDRVLKVTLRQVGELVGDAARLSEDVDALAAELSTMLASRASRLDLSGVALEGDVSPPPDSGWLARRRRRRATRVGARDAEAMERRLVGEISALIHADLRSWFEETRSGLGLTELDDRLPPVLGRMVGSSLEAWVTGAGTRSDLMARIDIAYEHFGALVTDLARSDLGELDVTEVRSALVAVMAETALADA